MAVYVTSDAHGHVRALDAALSQASPSSADSVYVLGDMIDRGPDPLGVVSLVRSLPQARAILGNHEQLMLAAIAKDGLLNDDGLDLGAFEGESYLDWSCWMQNGGFVTADQLDLLSADDRADLLSWVARLPRFEVTRAGGRTFALVHAGINVRAAHEWIARQHACSPVAPDAPAVPDAPEAAANPPAVDAAAPEAAAPATPDLTDPKTLRALLADQDPEDLLWIREGFWNVPTGLVDEKGEGPVVVAGHTPSVFLASLIGDLDVDVPCTTDEGQGTIVRVGASEKTGGVADRIDIDCAAAAGAGVGRVGVLRLDDGCAWFAAVEEGE